jgi:hypothetical protein
MPLIDILIADESDAATIASSHAPLESFPGIPAKDIDHAKLAKLALILNGLAITTPAVRETVRSFRQLHESSEDGPWVYKVPDELAGKLAGLSSERRAEVTQAWAREEEFARDAWDGTQVAEFVDSISDLATEARARAKQLLLWMAL